jgi:phospholipid transport system transporter-binding protein
MTSTELQVTDDGQVRITGPLEFATAGQLLESSGDMFTGHDSLLVDLSGVSSVDSAGLALLIEWLRLARQCNCAIRFAAVPDKLLAIAKLSGVDDIIAGSS